MIKKIFEKHETLMSILLIVLYVVVNSFCMQNFGLEDYRSTIINTIFSIALIFLIIKLERVEYYGLTKVKDLKKYLFFIPLVALVLWQFQSGININFPASHIVFHILTMFNIGFLEEIIFRGFLFKMMAKDGLKSAIIVSSLTFGLGHIVNLLNGADFIPTLMQVCYAVSIGYLFVVIFHKSKSLVPCIVTHSVFNAVSIFNDGSTSIYIRSIVIIVLSLGYAIYINKTVKE